MLHFDKLRKEFKEMWGEPDEKEVQAKRTVWRWAEGCRARFNRDGTADYRSPNGTVRKKWFPSGAIQTKWSDGRVRQQNANGTVINISKDGVRTQTTASTGSAKAGPPRGTKHSTPAPHHSEEDIEEDEEEDEEEEEGERTDDDVDENQLKLAALLQLACKSGDLKGVKQLFARKADINYRTPVKGYTALHQAARNGHADIVKALIAKNADVTIRTDRGDDALEVAQAGGHKAIIRILAAAATDTSSSSSSDPETEDGVPEDTPRPRRRPGAGRIGVGGAPARKMGRSVGNSLVNAAKAGKLGRVKALIARKANVDHRHPAHGYTALHQAAWNGYGHIVKFLLSVKADPTVRNKAGENALEAAQAAGRKQVIRILERTATAADSDADEPAEPAEPAAPAAPATRAKCVIDAANIGYFYGRRFGAGKFAARGVEVVLETLNKDVAKGEAPVAVGIIPQKFVESRFASTLADDVKLLQKLMAKAWLFLAPSRADDDEFIIQYAYAAGGTECRIVTNDNFRDHITKLETAGRTDRAAAKKAKWLRNATRKCCFVGDVVVFPDE